MAALIPYRRRDGSIGLATEGRRAPRRLSSLARHGVERIAAHIGNADVHLGDSRLSPWFGAVAAVAMIILYLAVRFG